MNKTVMKAFSQTNVLVYRLTGGKLWGGADGPGGSRICLVTMTGHKSGKQRTLPLICTRYNDEVVLIASQAGAPEHPIWYHNLMAHPEIDIQIGGDKGRYAVREASAEEKAPRWDKAVETYPQFTDYQAGTDRVIPLLICSPI